MPTLLLPNKSCPSSCTNGCDSKTVSGVGTCYKCKSGGGTDTAGCCAIWSTSSSTGKTTYECHDDWDSGKCGYEAGKKSAQFSFFKGKKCGPRENGCQLDTCVDKYGPNACHCGEYGCDSGASFDGVCCCKSWWTPEGGRCVDVCPKKYPGSIQGGQGDTVPGTKGHCRCKEKYSQWDGNEKKCVPADDGGVGCCAVFGTMGATCYPDLTKKECDDKTGGSGYFNWYPGEECGPPQQGCQGGCSYYSEYDYEKCREECEKVNGKCEKGHKIKDKQCWKCIKENLCENKYKGKCVGAWGAQKCKIAGKGNWRPYGTLGCPDRKDCCIIECGESAAQLGAWCLCDVKQGWELCGPGQVCIHQECSGTLEIYANEQVTVPDQERADSAARGGVPTTDVGVGDQSIAARDHWYACLVKTTDGCKLVVQGYPCEEDLTVDDCKKIETIGETCGATCADECAKMESSTMHVVKYYCENDNCECKLEPKYVPGKAGGAEPEIKKCPACSWSPCGAGYEDLGQLDCYEGQYCCVRACIGDIKLTFEKTAVKPEEEIGYVISGLANCDGKTAWIYLNDIIYGNCTMTDGTCIGTLDKTIGVVGGKAAGASGGAEENVFGMLVRLLKSIFG